MSGVPYSRAPHWIVRCVLCPKAPKRPRDLRAKTLPPWRLGARAPLSQPLIGLEYFPALSRKDRFGQCWGCDSALLR
jgi:hypothetical protein